MQTNPFPNAPSTIREKLPRRHVLRSSALAAAWGCFAANGLPLQAANPLVGSGALKKKVAAITTIYRNGSHADVLLGKTLEGWHQDGGPGPALELVSLVVDQTPEDDMSGAMARKHGFRICRTISEALTLGGDRLAVDGVISIGEHGEYPWNEFGQHLYPRKRFFEGIMDTFQATGQIVPVFNDKHPGPEWKDAVWMYERAKAMRVTWMAGSSLPVSFRSPDHDLPWQAKVRGAVAIGYSGLDIYGIHTLEFMQCILERRHGGETGISFVQSFPTASLGSLIASGAVQGDLLDAGLQVAGTDRATVLATPPADGAIFLVGYKDGLVVPVVMLASVAKGIALAVQADGQPLFATRVEEREKPYYPHFAYLLKGIETMIHSGQAVYPIERNMLTAGALDRLLVSHREGGKRIETPELEIAYEPIDRSYAPHLEL